MELLAEGRAAVGERDWQRALAAFGRVDEAGGLGADDLFSAADCAWWLGRIEESLAAYERTYRAYLEDGEPAKAALAALMLGAHASERGDGVIGAAWMNRARRLLEGVPESAEHGYPLYFEVFGAMGRGELDLALSLASRMQQLGRRFSDRNLVALGVLAEGRGLVKKGEAGRGMALLDDAMLAAVADELHPVWTGGIYCHLMDVCHELVDLQRAGEWTRATEAWCDRVTEAVLYRGICRVHRAQVYQRRGEWLEAEAQAIRASTELEGVHVGTVAEAHYELGELHRLRGEPTDAETRYRRAHELGRDPQPGAALLHLEAGQAEVAVTSLRTALADREGDPLGRVRLLSALVDAAVHAGDLRTAREASDELQATAEVYGTVGLTALAQQAQGAVLLAEGRPAEAREALRLAGDAWHQASAPYDAARTRLLLVRTLRALGDEGAAALELETAQETFERLGAIPDARRAAALRTDASPPDGLSPRELEVLRLVATGRTNREVAELLFISDKTVARHLANIYRKLELSTRSAATAYAFERGIVGPPTTSTT